MYFICPDTSEIFWYYTDRNYIDSDSHKDRIQTKLEASTSDWSESVSKSPGYSKR